MPKREPRETWTKVKTVRISDDIWGDAMAQAKEEGTTLTQVISNYLYRYGRHQRAKRQATTDD